MAVDITGFNRRRRQKAINTGEKVNIEANTDLTKAQIKEILAKKGIVYDNKSTKVELLELLNEKESESSA